MKEFKRGAVTLCAGIAWFFLATKLFIPFFAAGNGAYAYWTYTQLGPDPISSIITILKSPMLLYTTMVNPDIKVQTAKAVFYPFFLLPFFSPLIILAVPLISERFLSTNMIYWVKDFHYTSTIAPILAMAAADGLFNITKLISHKQLKTAVILGVSVLVLVMNLKDVPSLQHWSLTKPSFYQATENDKAGREALRKIPIGASVATQDVVIPHLTHRDEIYGITKIKAGVDVDYIIVNAALNPWPSKSADEVSKFADAKLASGYREFYTKDGWRILVKN